MSLTDVQALEREAVMATYARFPVELVRGDGTRVWDAEGNEYLDFLSGIAVMQLGHSHPAVLEAIRDQSERLVHVSNFFYTEPGLRLAQRLTESSIGGKAFLCNSGAEAVECAIKLARKRKRGGDFVVVERGFHGRTMGALSATPQEQKQAPFAPLVPGFRAVPAEGLPAAVDNGTAAVIVEPVQGEGGVHPMPAEVLASTREACDQHDALLVFDEVQCGMGRTGTLWAWQGAGVAPDVMTVAKGLAGGLPVGACVAAPDHADVLETSDHATTFGGGPVVSAAANAVLDAVDDERFLAGVAEKGERLAAAVRDLGLEVRGKGLLLAFAHPEAQDLVRRALAEQRLVLNAAGPDTVRLLPPLTVSEEEIDDAVSRIASLL